MAKKEVKEAPNVFGGFEALSKSLLPGGNTSVVDDPDSEIPYIDPDELEKDEDDTEEGEETGEEEESAKSKKSTKSKIEDEDEDEEEDENDKKPVGGKGLTKGKKEEVDESDDEDSTESEDDTEDIETEVASFLKGRLSEELGWDIDADEKFESIKDVVDYMKTLVEENSKPKYHSDDVKALDEYVRNGGTIDKYYREVYNSGNMVDYDNLDLSRESNQRMVIKEVLKEQGLSADRIQKRLDRYEKEEILADEAEDAVELLKEYKSKKEKKLLDDQKKFADDQVKQQQMFLENVQNSIKSLDDVRGIKISSREKQELLDYIFKPDSEGLTKYQRDYMSDVKNLIESAYFTKKGDALIKEAKKLGSSDAYREFHQKIKANKGKRSKNSGNLEGGSDSDFLLSSLSKSLLNKI